jgi:hypothetical protein
VVPWTLVAILLVVVIVVLFSRSHGHNVKSSTPSNSSQTSKTAAGTGSSSSTAESSSTKSSSSPAASSTPQTKVTKTVVNSDGTTTKEISSSVAIPFSSSSQNEVNLKRGATQILQAGQNGIQTTVYSVTYDKNGNEIARKTISTTTTKQPVNQITKIGVSDFNLNTDTLDGSESGYICLPADYTSGADGCVGVPSAQYFSAVEISGSFYVSCISTTPGICDSTATTNVQPVIMVQSNSTFGYQSTTYRADPRKGGGISEPLTSSICSQYGLACGSW